MELEAARVTQNIGYRSFVRRNLFFSFFLISFVKGQTKPQSHAFCGVAKPGYSKLHLRLRARWDFSCIAFKSSKEIVVLRFMGLPSVRPFSSSAHAVLSRAHCERRGFDYPWSIFLPFLPFFLNSAQHVMSLLRRIRVAKLAAGAVFHGTRQKSRNRAVKSYGHVKLCDADQACSEPPVQSSMGSCERTQRRRGCSAESNGPSQSAQKS